jgi:RNA polymerase sigma factor (sigma-70 family)
MSSSEVAILTRAQAWLEVVAQRGLPDGLLTRGWEELGQLLADAVCGLAYSYHIPDCDVEELSQEVWLQVLKALEGFRWDANRPGLRAWISKLVKCKAVDLLRRYRRLPMEEVSAADFEQVPDPLTGEDQRETDRLWRRQLLAAAFAKLRRRASPKSFAVIELQYVDGLSREEIAAKLDLTLEEVRYRHYRMIRRLRALVHLVEGRPLRNNSQRFDR